MKQNKSSAMSDGERLKLAAKLDKELDQFINSRPKRQEAHPVPFDSWEEEITTHPFFLKDTPEPGTKLHPLYEGLQKLKYDPEENEPEELALAYKDDGNFHFKHKNYRMAIISYTEGLKAKCSNEDIIASLYNNRSAAHYFVRNYRSALADAERGLKSNPGHMKMLSRAIQSCFHIRKFEKGVTFCDLKLERNPKDNETVALRNKLLREQKILQRDERKKELEEKRKKIEEQQIVEKILERGIKMEGGLNDFSQLEPKFPQLFNSRVTVSEGSLLWPVVLFYPEYKIMDYIQEFHESNTFFEQLACIFEDSPGWDEGKKYSAQSVNIYFENERRENVRIDKGNTLLEVLKMDGHIIKDGTPKFIILVANTDVEKSFLDQR